MLKKIVAKIPVSIKLLTLIVAAFSTGYVAGNFGYQKTEIIMQKICEVY